MGEVVQTEFGKKLHEINGLPKGTPELLNRLAVLAHDRNSIIKDMTEAERRLAAAQLSMKRWRESLASIDTKIRDTQAELVREIALSPQVRELVEGVLVQTFFPGAFSGMADPGAANITITSPGGEP